MTNVTPQSVVRQIGSLFEGAAVNGLSDRQLLDRFIARPDSAGEAAFAALVARHGPMVLSICNQLLGDQHHAEDAFQAVFLVLARRARSIRDPDLLGNWLYGIALRIARKARNRLARQRRTEDGCTVTHSEPASTITSEQVAIAREQAETLHEEIDRLPVVFRLPVVLCYFEGLTLDQAALRLRCPAGTIHSRLARARERLGRGLTRRGIIMPAAALAVALSPGSASASVSSHLCETTARAAISFAAGQAAAPMAADLAREVLRSMMLHRFKLASLTLFFVGVVATSTGYLTRSLARSDEPKSRATIPQAPALAKPDETNAKPAPGRMFVVGRVLDPQGKPVPGATVAASAVPKFAESAGGLERRALTELGHTGADAAGRFRLDSLRTSSSRNDGFVAIALAPGYGVGWAKSDVDADQPAADITLNPEQVIEGRLFDLNGRPAQGVAVSVSSIERQVGNDSGRPIVGRLFEGPVYEWTRVNDMPAWPKPATTDAEGRFTIHGVGRRLKAALSVIDPRFALQNIDVETDDAPGPKLVNQALEPANVFIGKVTDAETGKPVPHARVRFFARTDAIERRLFGITRFQADGEGRFRANPSPGERYEIYATPPDGKLYVETHKTLDWPKGAREQPLDLTLDRGAAIRGTVVEDGTGRPVAGAPVTYLTHSRADVNRPGWHSETLTASDGSFELAVVPRAGHLAIQAPSDDYILREIGILELAWGTPGGQRVYSGAFLACDPKLNGPGLDVHLALRRGTTVNGRVVGPDDQRVDDVWIIGRAALDPHSFAPAIRRWTGSYHGQASNGQFELHGLDPHAEIRVVFLQPKRKLGAVASLAGKSASGAPVTIRLEPCGSANARLVDAQGRSLAGYGNRSLLLIRLVITPGPEHLSRDPEDKKQLAGEADTLMRIDPINYFKLPISDSQGRISFPALIPGATYRISDFSTLDNGNGPIHLRREFTVKPGETRELGDILIEKPRAL